MTQNTFGRYQIKSEIGRGGMATVHYAFDPRFERDVAIKVLPREFLHDPQFRVRFEREAKMVAALEHAAIVPVYDFGEEDGQPYIVMRYMSGGSLEHRLKQGPLPITEVAKIFSRLAPALDAAHSMGIVHRDLKPGNILFDKYGKAFLSDFGIARLAQEGMATITGSAIIGTPAYMSPEQVQGDKELDGRSDVYAMGIILFQMLTGDMPYHANTPAKVMIMHLLEPVPHIQNVKNDLPPAFDHLIGQALAKNPDQRFQTAGDLAQKLETLVQTGGFPSQSPTHPQGSVYTPIADAARPSPTPSVASEASSSGAPREKSAPKAAISSSQPHISIEAQSPSAPSENHIPPEPVGAKAQPAEPPVALSTPVPPEQNVKTPQDAYATAYDTVKEPSPLEVDLLQNPRVLPTPERLHPQAKDSAKPVPAQKPGNVPPAAPGKTIEQIVRTPIPKTKPAQKIPFWLMAGVIAVCLFGIASLGGIALLSKILAKSTPMVTPSVANISVNTIAVGFYFTSNRDGKWEIYQMDVAGKTTRITYSSGDSESMHPQPIPDDGLYFGSDRDGKWEIYRMDILGNTVRITNTPGNGGSMYAAPIPGGGLYFTSDRSGKNEIYRMDINGQTTQITNTPGDGTSWGAVPIAGGGLYFCSNRDGKNEIYQMDVSGQTTRITNTPGDAASWDPAPIKSGGLYFTSDRSGRMEIYLMNANGETTQITTTPDSGNSSGAALIQGGGFYFTSNRDGKWEIYRMSVDGTTNRITNSPGDRESWGAVPPR